MGAEGELEEADRHSAEGTITVDPIRGPNEDTNNDDAATSKKEKGIELDVVSAEKGAAGGPPAQQQESSTILHGHRLALVFVGLALAIFLAALDQSIVATALPKITSEFGAIEDLPWVATAYLLASTAFQPLYGRFSDIFGRKPVFIFALVVFELGSILCGAAQNMIWLIIARGIQGLGGGGLMALVIIIISDVVSLQDRGKYQGIIGASFGVASVVGPLLGGAFTDTVSWRWCFYINLPFGALTLIAIIVFLKLPLPQGSWRSKLHRIDYFGILALVPAVVCLLLATNWGGSQYPWDSAVVISLYITSGLLLVVFWLIEMYVAREPIIQFRLFKIRNVSLAYLASFFTGLCMLGTIIYLPIYFQLVRGYTATSSGLRMLPLMIGIVIASMSSGIVVSKTGYLKPWPVAGSAILIMGMGLLSILEQESSFGQMIGLLIPTGLGLGCSMQIIILIVQNSVPRKEIASATAGVTFFRSIGFVIGVAIFGAIVNNIVAAKLVGLSGGGAAAGGENIRGNIEALNRAPQFVQDKVHDAYMTALKTAFQASIAFAGAALIMAIFLHNTKIVPVARGPGAGAPPGAPAGGPHGQQQGQDGQQQKQAQEEADAAAAAAMAH